MDSFKNFRLIVISYLPISTFQFYLMLIGDGSGSLGMREAIPSTFFLALGIMFALSLAVTVGLYFAWNPARYFYLAIWVLGLLNSLLVFASPIQRYMMTERFLAMTAITAAVSGAILVLSFSGGTAARFSGKKSSAEIVDEFS